MKRSTKIIIGIITLCIILFTLWFGYNFAPGSYAYAERYELNVYDSTLINAIERFKENNPQYNVPKEVNVKDGNDETGNWFFVYFYYPEENQIILTWTRVADRGKSTFAFVGLNDGLVLGNWKDINKDFSRSENKEQKRKFEERILNKLNIK